MTNFVVMKNEEFYIEGFTGGPMKKALLESKDLERAWNNKKRGPVSYRDLSRYSKEGKKHYPIFLKREYKDEYLIPFGNILLLEGKEENYPETCPTEYTISQIKDRYLLEAEFKARYWHKSDKIAWCISVVLHNDKDFYGYEEPLEILDKMFYHHGYFRSTPDLVYTKSETRVIQYEPFHFETTKRLRLPDLIYHVTTTDNKQSILDNGFIASCKSTVELQYPPRNYFFRQYRENLLVNYMYNALKIPRENEDDNDVVIFHISTKKISDIKFFNDPMFNEKEAVYTYDDVPASAIVETIYTKF